eukprot:6486136-Amphidinium_carterae.3
MAPLGAISQGIQRRQEKVDRWTAKCSELRVVWQGLEPQMYKELEPGGAQGATVQVAGAARPSGQQEGCWTP